MRNFKTHFILFTTIENRGKQFYHFTNFFNYTNFFDSGRHKHGGLPDAAERGPVAGAELGPDWVSDNNNNDNNNNNIFIISTIGQ